MQKEKTIITTIAFTVEQSEQAILLLKRAFVVTDYWNHKGEDSKKIREFLEQFDQAVHE